MTDREQDIAAVRREVGWACPALKGLSEAEAARDLLTHCADRQVGLPVQYCASMYKRRLQGRGNLGRLAAIARESFEETTEAGYAHFYENYPPASARDKDEMVRELKTLRALEPFETLGEGLPALYGSPSHTSGVSGWSPAALSPASSRCWPIRSAS